ITISAAAGEDAVGWILLASVAALAGSLKPGGEGFDPWLAARMAGLTLVFGLGMIFLARPLLIRFTRWAVRAGQGELSVNALAAPLVILFLCAVITNVIGIFAVFGAFTLGAILSDQHEFREAVNRRVRDFVMGFFLPIFFAYTGLRTRVDTLTTGELWALAAAVSAVAIVGKVVGCAAAARLAGLT